MKFKCNWITLKFKNKKDTYQWHEGYVNTWTILCRRQFVLCMHINIESLSYNAFKWNACYANKSKLLYKYCFHLILHFRLKNDDWFINIVLSLSLSKNWHRRYCKDKKIELCHMRLCFTILWPWFPCLILEICHSDI